VTNLVLPFLTSLVLTSLTFRTSNHSEGTPGL